MRNDGTKPDCERVDIKFRGGHVVRAVAPGNYRWTLDDDRFPPAYAFDIATYQPADRQPRSRLSAASQQPRRMSMRTWHWKPLALIVAGAAIGTAGGWYALADDAPRWITAWAALLLIVGVACSLLLVLLLWMFIIQDVRPKLVARRPIQPLMLATELGALVGTRRFNTHPVRFWSGLILNHRVFFGLLVFAQSEELTLPAGIEGRG